jgi:ATP-binding protein involved in chromosome partitioning
MPAAAGATAAGAALEGITHAVAIGSGKGGVGKSTVSVNLALALAAQGAAVGLLDADIYGPSLPTLLGIHRRPDVAGDKLVPLTAHGLQVMSLGFLMPEGAPVVWRGAMVSSAIQQLLRDVAWGRLEYLLVDLPPGTGDAQLTLAQALPLAGALIVMTPQDLAMQIASKAVAMFRQLRVPILGVLENMSGFACPHCGGTVPVFRTGGGRVASQRQGVPFLGEVPLDPMVCQTSDRGAPIVIAEPDSPAAAAFRSAASALAARVREEAAAAPAVRLG